ncbi:MAG: carbon-nitrogen hydrolase family protein [Hyphomicrobiaceae bacterium]
MSDTRKFNAALIQTCTSRDVDRNLREIGAMIREAAGAGAQYVQTPEVTTVLETDSKRMPDVIRPEQDNPALAHYADLATELGIWLHIGSMAVATDEPRYANRAFLFAPSGALAARYDKIHMFDVQIGEGQTYRESKRYAPGQAGVLADLPWGTLGITICYDMRFPGLYRALAKAGAEILAVPSSFTVPTGKAHWHTILRARAIENQCFVLAAAQAGDHECGRQTYGHSIAISPWGEVLVEADGESTGVIMAEIDLDAVAKARSRIPSLDNDQPFDIIRAQPM